MTTTSQYADKIMTKIHEDMNQPFPWGKQIPRDVGSFSELHDYCDANCYLLDLIPQGENGMDDTWTELVNAVSAEVDKRLAAEAVALGTGQQCGECGRLTRFNGGHGHGHWIHLDDGTHQCWACQFCTVHLVAKGGGVVCGDTDDEPFHYRRRRRNLQSLPDRAGPPGVSRMTSRAPGVAAASGDSGLTSPIR